MAFSFYYSKEHPEMFNISDEIADAVKKSLSHLDDSQLADIRNSIDNSIELQYDIRNDLEVDAPVDKISTWVYSQFVIAGTGNNPLFVANVCNEMKISGTIVTVTVTIFDRTKDDIFVWDDFHGMLYGIPMSKYESFDEAMQAALDDTAPDAVYALIKGKEA